ncbi:MAG: hypothetical protein K9K66_19010 [Desulfarculaceae bacterium]|nr:hypothetical protein [Desulfarculaceae bacterium]MCF8073593.1 hypothetical protein [Desulfarculaceae bacterium]MCF8103750.1 hypothetical protein [Desulfarculaceae bacterium]MCF8115691.1 hypothetical protein [Desulfarculaceae bacterium]
MKKIIATFALILLGSGLISGCYTTGKVAGDTVKGVESGTKDLQKGYEDGKKGN